MTYILISTSLYNALITTMWVVLGALVFFILYRQLLKRLGRGIPPKEDYCVLFGLEENPAKGEIPFYFTSHKAKAFKLILMDAQMNELQIIEDKMCTAGGNIVRFDSTSIANGDYYYCLQTENQKTTKRMRVENR